MKPLKKPKIDEVKHEARDATKPGRISKKRKAKSTKKAWSTHVVKLLESSLREKSKHVSVSNIANLMNTPNTSTVDESASIERDHDKSNVHVMMTRSKSRNVTRSVNDYASVTPVRYKFKFSSKNESEPHRFLLPRKTNERSAKNHTRCDQPIYCSTPISVLRDVMVDIHREEGSKLRHPEGASQRAPSEKVQTRRRVILCDQFDASQNLAQEVSERAVPAAYVKCAEPERQSEELFSRNVNTSGTPVGYVAQQHTSERAETPSGGIQSDRDVSAPKCTHSGIPVRVKNDSRQQPFSIRSDQLQRCNQLLGFDRESDKERGDASQRFAQKISVLTVSATSVKCSDPEGQSEEHFSGNTNNLGTPVGCVATQHIPERAEIPSKGAGSERDVSAPKRHLLKCIHTEIPVGVTSENDYQGNSRQQLFPICSNHLARCSHLTGLDQKPEKGCGDASQLLAQKISELAVSSASLKSSDPARQSEGLFSENVYTAGTPVSCVDQQHISERAENSREASQSERDFFAPKCSHSGISVGVISGNGSHGDSRQQQFSICSDHLPRCSHLVGIEQELEKGCGDVSQRPAHKISDLAVSATSVKFSDPESQSEELVSVNLNNSGSPVGYVATQHIPQCAETPSKSAGSERDVSAPKRHLSKCTHTEISVGISSGNDSHGDSRHQQFSICSDHLPRCGHFVGLNRKPENKYGDASQRLVQKVSERAVPAASVKSSDPENQTEVLFSPDVDTSGTPVGYVAQQNMSERAETPSEATQSECDVSAPKCSHSEIPVGVTPGNDSHGDSRQQQFLNRSYHLPRFSYLVGLDRKSEKERADASQKLAEKVSELALSAVCIKSSVPERQSEDLISGNVYNLGTPLDYVAQDHISQRAETLSEATQSERQGPTVDADSGVVYSISERLSSESLEPQPEIPARPGPIPHRSVSIRSAVIDLTGDAGDEGPVPHPPRRLSRPGKSWRRWLYKGSPGGEGGGGGGASCERRSRRSSMKIVPLARPIKIELREELEKIPEKRTPEDLLPSPRDDVLRVCGQRRPERFDALYDERTLAGCAKIGEGTYGEVFRLVGSTTGGGGGRRVMKVIPIEGDRLVNDERQKRFGEVLSEIKIATALSDLRGSSVNSADTFNEVYCVRCVRGAYPRILLNEWDEFHRRVGSENDHPGSFRTDQLYVILELRDGGTSLDVFEFDSPRQSYYAFQQIAFALAVAEKALKFEHRDLHWGNVLLAEDDPKGTVEFRLEGMSCRIPTIGVRAMIIDFTLSRVESENMIIFNDLAEDEELFEGDGDVDYQFEIYRLMRERNGNDWQGFQPYSNVLWLHYLLDKVVHVVKYARKTSKVHKGYINRLKALKDEILTYDSVMNFVTSKFVHQS